MSVIKSILYFLGFFALNDFEEKLIQLLKDNLSAHYKAVIDCQLTRFNKVDRVIKNKRKLKFGHTSFYWVRFGKARIDYPLKFPMEKEGEVLAEVDVYCEDGNLIKVSYYLVKGFLFSIEYRSKNNIFQPISKYEFRNFRLVKLLNK